MFNIERRLKEQPAMFLVWLTVLCSMILVIMGQSQNAIGAHRIYQKTSFSCSGRPAGYYADVETGCQVYHMCDGLGRQFSYSCPNTTLFQQRMLICDHWYMVNCSKAESDYAANLLIGQRDKPFVNDEENNLRTPRPDLLDRPYAPDYSGESFRNQYNKQLPAAQNQISDDTHKNDDKPKAANQLGNGQTRWKIPPPSRTILPPAYEPQIDNVDKQKTNAAVTSFKGFSASTSATLRTTTVGTSTTTTRRPIVVLQPSSTAASTQFNSFANAALHPRKPVVYVAGGDHDDLGTSHSTRYNTSADFNSAEVKPIKVTKPPNGRKLIATLKPSAAAAAAADSTIKTPSKIYEPPFVYPIYNLDEATGSGTTATSGTGAGGGTGKPLLISTAAPFSSSFFSSSSLSSFASKSTTTRPATRPTTVAGKPFAPTATAQNSGRNQNNLFQTQTPQNQPFEGTQFIKNTARTPTPAQGFKPPTPRPPVSTAKTLKPPLTQVPHKSADTFGVNAELPFNDLLPPHVDIVLHDVATTQGPPIYYEWKVPSNGLEPPKLESPIGVNGREYPDTLIDYNNISSGSANSKTDLLNDKNPFLTTAIAAAAATKSSSSSSSSSNSQTTRIPTSRSIKETGQPNAVNKSSSKKAQRRLDNASPTDITEIRKELSVPDYAFPLETVGRTGYLSSDTYNSFLLKIPDRHNEKDDKLHWFGENPKCPECHPSYVVPGTCEPCLRR